MAFLAEGYYLAYCNERMQMINHYNGECMKCIARKDKKNETKINSFKN